MPEIRLEEVSKYYKQENRRIAVVEDINLVIRQGEFVFVTGSSGAGKSTLLQLIHGQLRPDHGSIYLNDTDTTHFRRWGRERYRRQVGYVPQIPQLMRQKTIRENLETVVMIGRRRREGTRLPRLRRALLRAVRRGAGLQLPGRVPALRRHGNRADGRP